MGGWKKQEPISDLIVLGDNAEADNVKECGGLLASTRQDSQYPDRLNYELVQKDGSSKWLAGSASIMRQLGPAHIGAFVKCQFVGWGRSPRGEFKEIAVHIWEGELTELMLGWPRLDEVKGGFAAVPEALKEEEESDLPFD